MAVIAIICPRTTKLVDAGLSPTTKAEFDDWIPRGELRTDCPACGALHYWRKKDAELIGNPHVAIAPLYENQDEIDDAGSQIMPKPAH